MHRKSAYFLSLAVLAMLVIGIVMLFSTSAYAADKTHGVYFFVKRQSAWLAVGLVLCALATAVDYHFWVRTWWIWFSLSAIALVLCYVPHVGMRINGSRRWIGFHGVNFQPSEVAKVAAIFFLAYWFSRHEKASARILQGFCIPLAVVSVLLALILGEVDLGTTSLIGGTTFVMMFVAGTNAAIIGSLSMVGVSSILFIAWKMPERAARLLAFLHPEKNPLGAGLQQTQALLAWKRGGIEGLGLGNGLGKMAYLPYAHTDFIFPMIGEELGLRFSLAVVSLFVVIIICGTMIALHAKDRVGLLLGTGVLALLTLQAAVNIGVTTSLLPNKGLPLPFISYGGSNLAACLFGIGLLLSIYRQGNLEPLVNKRRTQLQVRMTPRI